MNREQILAMGQGRELDALVAENVMGWHTFSPIDPDCDHSVGVNGYRRNFAFDPNDDKYKPFPLFSTDISAAWKVVEKIQESGCCVEVGGYTNEFSANITKPSENGVRWLAVCNRVSSAPEAICKAALIATLDPRGGDAQGGEQSGTS